MATERISTSFSRREVEWMALAFEALHHGEQEALTALAEDEASFDIASKFERLRRHDRPRLVLSRVSDETVAQIRAERSSGKTLVAIGKQFNLSTSYIHRIVHGQIRQPRAAK